ncbi:hypothetical protein J6590_071479 [Homalodisca vitripennis]|nr:hypothetical protein J6590_071479 [Homalodisca vitripennis]
MRDRNLPSASDIYRAGDPSQVLDVRLTHAREHTASFYSFYSDYALFTLVCPYILAICQDCDVPQVRDRSIGTTEHLSYLPKENAFGGVRLVTMEIG